MIYKRNDHWHMDVTVHGTRYREALNSTDRREAKALESRRIAEIQQGKVASKTGREFARKPFGDAANIFVEERIGHVAQRTVQFERERLKPLSRYFGDKPLVRIKAEDIASYPKARMTAGLSGKTINIGIGVLRLMVEGGNCWSMGC